jgi:hypothetical protein
MHRRQFLAAPIAASTLAIAGDVAAQEGLNAWLGELIHRGVAESQQRAWTAPAKVLS